MKGAAKRARGTSSGSESRQDNQMSIDLTDDDEKAKKACLPDI
jgi:hypothetical protein